MKLNKKGFTLIELLAVITIMGILMMVAIPAVSRTIENSRRDTYGNLAKQYIETIRNAVIADELTCGGKQVSATTAGKYYFVVTTAADLGGSSVQNTLDLMESGGKSSWGGNNVAGMVVWEKKNSVSGATSGFTTEYYIYLVDEGNHGIDSLVSEENVKRSNVLAKTTRAYTDVDTLAELQAVVAANAPDSFTIQFTDTTAAGYATQCTLNT